MPPVDVIDLRNNENDLSKNIAIVFVGNAPHYLPGCSISRITDAGDIRSVMKTINSLPEDFAGTLEIIINDPDAMVATRNLAILSLLGYFPDDILAVNAAMHYWFSAFMPYECTAAHGGCFQEVLASDVKKISFGEVGSSISMGLSNVAHDPPEWISDFNKGFIHVFTDHPLSLAQAASIRKNSCYPTADDRDRLYAQIHPGDRVSLERYMSTGIVMPFGSQTSHISAPNPYLFSAARTWTPPVVANPLHGWE